MINKEKLIKIMQHLDVAALTLLMASLSMPRRILALGVIISMLLLLVHFILNKPKAYHSGFNFIFTLTFVLYFLIHTISLIWTDNFSRGIGNLETKIYFLVMPLLFRFTHVRISNFNLLVYSFVFSVSFIVILCFGDAIQYKIIYNDAITPFKYYNFVFSMGLHPGYLSMLVLISLIGIGYLLPSVVNKNTKIILFFLGAFQVFAVIFIGARFAIILLPILLILLMIGANLKIRPYRSSVIGISVILFGIAIAISALQVSKNAKVRMQGSKESFNIRKELSEAAFNLIKEKPWLGYGVGGEQNELFVQYKIMNNYEFFEKGYNVHNQFLQTVLETGVVGLLIFLVMLSSCFVQSEKRLFTFLVLLVFVSFFMIESALERQYGVIPFITWMLILKYSTKINDVAF